MAKLLEVLQRLVDAGNTVLVIEHNLDVIKQSDWVIDLGPEGGDAGGRVIATGTPEQVAEVEESYTGQFLRGVLPAPPLSRSDELGRKRRRAGAAPGRMATPARLLSSTSRCERLSMRPRERRRSRSAPGAGRRLEHAQRDVPEAPGRIAVERVGAHAGAAPVVVVHGRLVAVLEVAAADAFQER